MTEAIDPNSVKAVPARERSSSLAQRGSSVCAALPVVAPVAGVPIERDSIAALAPYYRGLVRPLADLSALMMVAWREPLSLRMRTERGILLMFAAWQGQSVLWGPPLGDGLNIDAVYHTIEELDDLNGGPGRGRILYVWEDYPLWSAISSDPSLSLEPQAREYVYATSALASLSGRSLRTKRHAARRFTRRHAPAVESYDSSMRQACLDVVDLWNTQRESRVAIEHQEKYHLELSVCRRAFQDDLPLEGVVAFVGDRPAGFSVGAAHGGNAFNCMFEKTNSALGDASAYVFSELARHCEGRFIEINAGEDWGVGYLRHSKASWRPQRIQCSYTLRRRVT